MTACDGRYDDANATVARVRLEDAEVYFDGYFGGYGVAVADGGFEFVLLDCLDRLLVEAGVEAADDTDVGGSAVGVDCQPDQDYAGDLIFTGLPSVLGRDCGDDDGWGNAGAELDGCGGVRGRWVFRSVGGMVGCSVAEAVVDGDGGVDLRGLAVEEVGFVFPLSNGVDGTGGELRGSAEYGEVLYIACLRDDALEDDCSLDLIGLGTGWVDGVYVGEQLSGDDSGRDADGFGGRGLIWLGWLYLLVLGGGGGLHSWSEWGVAGLMEAWFGGGCSFGGLS